MVSSNFVFVEGRLGCTGWIATNLSGHSSLTMGFFVFTRRPHNSTPGTAIQYNLKLQSCRLRGIVRVNLLVANQSSNIGSIFCICNGAFTNRCDAWYSRHLSSVLERVITKSCISVQPLYMEGKLMVTRNKQQQQQQQQGEYSAICLWSSNPDLREKRSSKMRVAPWEICL